MKTIDIKGKDYVQVSERINHFRTSEEYTGWSIETNIHSIDGPYVTIRTVIRDQKGVLRSTGIAQEKEGSTFINKASHVENCETSSIGRALGILGIGVDASLATAEEVKNAMEAQSNYDKKLEQALNKIISLLDSDVFTDEQKRAGVEACKGYSLTEAENIIPQYESRINQLKKSA